MAGVSDQYDELFDAWGKALNVNPQLTKTVWWLESTHNPNPPNGAAGEIGPMQIKPETGAMLARRMGYDPRTIDLRDMRWAIPLATQYLADGLNATKSAEGALGYYNSGSADPRAWNQAYIQQGVKTYPNMPLHLQPPQADDADTSDQQ